MLKRNSCKYCRNDWDEISGPCFTHTHTHIRTHTRTHTHSGSAIEHARLFSNSIFNGSPMERCTIEIKVSLSLSANAIDPVWHYPMPSPRLASHRLIVTIWYHIHIHICRSRDRVYIHIVNIEDRKDLRVIFHETNKFIFLLDRFGT